MASAPDAPVLSSRTPPPPGPLPLPPSVVETLQRWWLLADASLALLVPDPQLLPMESVRFFRVDQRWQRALVAGAFSVGRSSGDQLDRDAATLIAALPEIAASSNPPAIPTLTGVLLRSRVVAGWPSLRVVGNATSGERVTPIRCDRLGETLLIALFPGELASVFFSEPAEVVHFGADSVDLAKPTAARTKDLRAITGASAGKTLGVGVGVPTRANGVVAIKGLAASIQPLLDAHHGNDEASGGPRAFTPREFAVVMVRGVQNATITLAASTMRGLA